MWPTRRRLRPIGNGHPLAAVITPRAIAEAFDNGRTNAELFLAALDRALEEALGQKPAFTG